jgi:transcription antitermination protein NusB
MLSPRRRGREIALQVLFQLDANRELDARTAIAHYFDHLSGGDEEDLPGRDEPADREFAEMIVREVSARRERLDQDLAQISRNWRVERMAQVDRNVLRLALYELKHVPEIPARVSINEAIELAKRFGSVEASSFVNGVLDAALKTLEIRK